MEAAHAEHRREVAIATALLPSIIIMLLEPDYCMDMFGKQANVSEKN
jgi:hypothetical protein